MKKYNKGEYKHYMFIEILFNSFSILNLKSLLNN